MPLFADDRNPYRPPLPAVLALAREDFEFAISARNEDAIGRVAEWTVMAYLAADCNLAHFMFDDVMEMKSVGSGPAMHVCALFDGPLLTDAFFARLNAGTALRDDLVVRWRELATNKPETLTMALQLASYYPGRRRVLFLGGHGNGWRGLLTDEDRGMKYGRVELQEPAVECDARMKRSQLAAQECLNRRSEAIHKPGSPRWDVLAIDACYMGNIEAIAGLVDHADVLLVSEDLMPGDGYPYDRVLNVLRSDSSQSPVAFASAAVAATQAFYHEHGRRVTQVALSTSAMPQFAAALLGLNQALVPGLFKDDAVLGHIRWAINTAHRFDNKDYVDLPGFVLLLRDRNASTEISSHCAAVLEAWSRTVVPSAAPVAAEAPNGLSIYAPTPDRFDMAYVEHSNTLGLNLGSWTWFLASYYMRILRQDAPGHPLLVAMQDTMESLMKRGIYPPPSH